MNGLLYLLILYGLFATAHTFIVPKLLLPYYDKIQVNYTINADEGCYKWRSQNTDVASIKAIPNGDEDEDCTKSAIVYVESREPTRRITLILAENELTGTILQCDVIIDRINSIDITSRTRELYLEDPPEILKIRALDAEGNTFSSTAFMLFDWSLEADLEANDGEGNVMPAHSILKVNKFIETDYSAEDYVEKLEKAGVQSDTILLSGLQTGTAYVAAELKSVKDVMSVKVGITVRDKVFLIPSGDVWLPQYGMIRYLVEQWRSGRSTEVAMPHQQYYLQLKDSYYGNEGPIVTLDQETSTVTGLLIGNGQLNLHDRNLKLDAVQGTSDIHVVEPAYLKFSIDPDNLWILERKRFYVIHIHIYDGDNHRLWPSSNLRISAGIDPYYFRVLDSSKNGTWHSVEALRKGETQLYAKLNGIILQNGDMSIYDPVIEAAQIAEIFDPITVHPPILIFPWQPVPVLYKYKLLAEGGSGNYTWSINDDSFAIVSTNGVVTTKVGPEQEKIHEIASAIVRATDVKNPAHWGSSDVMLLPVVEIMFARSHREAEIEDYLDLYLIMLANVNGKLVPVVDCRPSGVAWMVVDTSIFRDVEESKLPIPDPTGTKACVGRRFRALREGYTTVTATYTQTDMDGVSTELEASVTVAAFPPLTAIDPVELAVVSLDSAKLLRFKGGPIRWPHWHAGYERSATNGDSRLLSISSVQMAQQEHHIVSQCMRLGEADVRLSVHNKPCNTNPLPVQAAVTVRVSCAVPDRLELTVPLLLPTCPLHNTDLIQTVALLQNPLPVNLTTFDASGHMFDNFSSIHTEWDSQHEDTHFAEDNSFFTSVDATEQRRHIVNKIVGLASIEGEQIISVSLPRYKYEMKEEICQEYNCTRLDPVVSGSVGILVVSEPSLVPAYFILYNHENCTAEVRISGGSGHFSHSIKQEGEVTEILDGNNNILKLGAVRAGNAQLQVTDLCLDSVPVILSDIVVAEVGRLHLKAPPRLELQSWAEVTLNIIDNFDHELPPRFLQFIDLELVASVPDIVSTEAVHAAPGNLLVVSSDLKGENVGTTMLSAVARLRDGRLIRSNAVRIVVFPALELQPSLVTLIKHAVYQLRTVGGPRSDFTMEFSVDKSPAVPVVNVSQSGVVFGLSLGSSAVSARAIMHDGTIFHCKAPSLVRVVQLAGIRIDAPLTQFHVGGFVPLHVSGLDDEQNPLSFGSAVPGLVFEWEVVNPSVAKLHTVHDSVGIETSSFLSFTMLAEGMSSGHCVVRVRVTAEDKSLNQLTLFEFYAEISLMIYDPLALVCASSKQWKSTSNFLITPSTEHRLNTNRDGVAQTVAYDVLRTNRCTQETLYAKEDATDCITVDQYGVLRSNPNQCQSTLLVTSVERFGLNQTLALHVLVRPVAYVIARAVTKFRTRDNSPISYSFPLSATIKFVVDQFDDVGDKFDATSHNVILNMNRYDKLEVEPDSGNRSFLIRTPLEGTTIMSVASYLLSTTSPTAIYYFPVHVQHAIHPQHKVLTVGLKFCYTSEFINLNGSGGTWSSSNPKMLLVEESTGAVVATSKTNTDVGYAIDSFSSKAQASSVPFIANFIPDKIPNHVLSKSATYVLPITLSPSYEYSESSNCDGLAEEMDVLAYRFFVCTVKFKYSNTENIFSVKPQYMSDFGGFACVVTRQDISEENEGKLATVDDEILVKLQSKSSELGSIRGGEALIQFLPSFVTEINSRTLVVGSRVILCIKAIPLVFESIEVSPCETNVVEIEADKDNLYGSYCYRISTNNQDVTLRSAYVRITSSLTGQDEKIDLTIDRVVGRIMSSPSSCSSPDQALWRGANDVLADTYLPYLTTASAIIISTAFLIFAFAVYRWVSITSANPNNSSFLPRTPPPYDAANTTLSSPGSPGSTPKVRLWSRYYQPQQAAPSTG